MDDSLISSNAMLNAAAVWFILKATEVIVFVGYDFVAGVVRCIRNRTNPDPDLREVMYDRKRGKLEYVFSGAGFLNIDLCRNRRILLLLISTIIPMAVFVLELMSIILGNESRACRTSRDPNIISSPALVLFGPDMRHGNLITAIEEAGLGTIRGLFRPCISWSPRHSGVDFFATLCADLDDAVDHHFVSDSLSLSNQPTGAFLGKRSVASFVFPLVVSALQSNTSRDNRVQLGTITFTSEVVVNGKNSLFQNATTVNVIREETKNEIIRDVRVFEQAVERKHSTYFEDDRYFGFIWDDAFSYSSGVIAVVYAILAQATREPIKSAARMSNQNDGFTRDYEISCDEDFKLPRIASIIIIVVAVISRLILIFIRTRKSSVEFALQMSKEQQTSN